MQEELSFMLLLFTKKENFLQTSVKIGNSKEILEELILISNIIDLIKKEMKVEKTT